MPSSFRAVFAALAVGLTAGPALAIDCGKAHSKVEVAICADPALKSADDAMTAAYVKLKDASDVAGMEALRISQLRWIKRRETCEEDIVADLKACIAGETARRKAVLTAYPVTGGEDASELAPWFIQKEGKPGGWDISLDLVRFSDPRDAGEALFNREAEALALPSLLENSALGTETIKVEPDAIYARSVSLSPAYASRRLISALAEGYDDTGGAHPNTWRRGINISLEDGRLLTYGDLFTRTATSFIAKLCTDQLVVARKVRTGDRTMSLEEGADLLILSHVKDLERWVFYADRAEILFDPYILGSYSEGPYGCELPMAGLRSLARPGAPLPK